MDNDNGRHPRRANKLEAELVIRWDVGQHMPKQILLPKGVTLASILGMMRLAEKVAIEEYDVRASSSIILPRGTRPR